MIHKLTDKQLQALRWIVKHVKDDKLGESFITTDLTANEDDSDVLMLGELRNPDFIDFGVLDVLTVSGALIFNPGYRRYTLTQTAYEIADFDFNNPEPDPLSLYMKEVYPLIQKHFDREELKGLCLELDVQLDWVLGDKTDWPLHLLLYLYRQNRLNKLPAALQSMRPGIDWPPYPGQETAVNSSER